MESGTGLINTILGFLDTEISDTFGVDGIHEDIFFRLVQKGEIYPPQKYPYLYIVPGPFKPEIVEFGSGDGDADWRYQINLLGGVYAASQTDAIAGMETLAKRLSDWLIHACDGLTDGVEVAEESMPGPVQPSVTGAGASWTGTFAIPYIVRTSR